MSCPGSYKPPVALHGGPLGSGACCHCGLRFSAGILDSTYSRRVPLHSIPGGHGTPAGLTPEEDAEERRRLANQMGEQS